MIIAPRRSRQPGLERLNPSELAISRMTAGKSRSARRAQCGVAILVGLALGLVLGRR